MFQIEFQLTNLGQDGYFAISVKETSVNIGHVNFPDTSLTHGGGLSEFKAYVRKDETHVIVLALYIPMNARIGTTKVITVEAQPYVNTNTGIEILLEWFKNIAL